MIGYYNYTVIATYLSLASSVAGIFIAAAGKPYIAIFCLMFSGLLDAFDGRIARTKTDRDVHEQRFGVQIDSLCDLVCFGVLPAVIGYFACRPALDSVYFYIYIVCATVHVLGGVIRLSIYNIGEEDKRDRGITKEKPTYTGMPITTVVLIYPLVYLLRRPLSDNIEIFTVIWSVMLLVTGFLFVCKFHIRKPSLKGLILLIVFGAIIAAIVGVVYGVSKR